ncbi:putative cyclin-dependent kinase regulatory subunit CKS1 [Blattamonas nauphoetae]|uniref:Cyclin-dependent kinases regulatory subunit n=1 Tax=Blattamonas nauphoetae TaxID=2049346 RepID=A0ABQ9YHQ0_9EUKA|nr:putative cyclin-dependent kinase regulatory subunit CKS1 [Blattamonas nauphoetae]
MAQKPQGRDLQAEIYYSDRISDSQYEYRHVTLPKELVERVPKDHLMDEKEWREIGICQSTGWACTFFSSHLHRAAII